MAGLEPLVGVSSEARETVFLGEKLPRLGKPSHQLEESALRHEKHRKADDSRDHVAPFGRQGRDRRRVEESPVQYEDRASPGILGYGKLGCLERGHYGQHQKSPAQAYVGDVVILFQNAALRDKAQNSCNAYEKEQINEVPVRVGILEKRDVSVRDQIGKSRVLGEKVYASFHKSLLQAYILGSAEPQGRPEERNEDGDEKYLPQHPAERRLFVGDDA